MNTNSPKTDRRTVRLFRSLSTVLLFAVCLLKSSASLRATDVQTINDFDWYSVNDTGESVDLNSYSTSSYNYIYILGQASADDGFGGPAYADGGGWIESSGGNYAADSSVSGDSPVDCRGSLYCEDITVDGSGNWTAGTVYRTDEPALYNASFGDGNLTMGGYADSSLGNGAQVWNDLNY